MQAFKVECRLPKLTPLPAVEDSTHLQKQITDDVSQLPGILWKPSPQNRQRTTNFPCRHFLTDFNKLNIESITPAGIAHSPGWSDNKVLQDYGKRAHSAHHQSWFTRAFRTLIK